MSSSTTSPPHGSWERLEHFSRLAGPLTVPPAGQPYRVQFRNQRKLDGRWRHAKALLIALLNVCFEIVFFAWLLRPDHIGATYAGPVAEAARIANLAVIVFIAVVELLRLVNVISLSLASIAARDPIPVVPDPGVRVAFLTTIVPSKEPIAVVADTLRAATRIRHDGVFDIWLLDEGDDPAVKAVCAELGVRHFTRRGVERYNQEAGAFRAKTKHGNYNAWIDAHGARYDVLLSVDPDHVPLANFAERILGYFRDPDVAYAVGPQCYKNSEQFVTRAAESQQFPFHSVIQRAANLYGTPMLVGTNNAIRIDALRSIGGLSDSITEDMATGLSLHTSRNPATGNRWKSVYTPDVLSAGEGPTSWSDYFSQQRRWSRGTFEILSGTYWRRFAKLSPAAMLHYTLITTFYPSMAIGWLLGIVNAILFLGLGVTGLTIAPQTWLALYTDATVFSLWLYIHHRRYNVSPYEPPDSWGLTGMLMSIIAAPLYAGQLCSTIARRPAKFVVTPKGESSSRDGLRTFRNHLGWCAVLVAAIAVSVIRHYAGGAALLWPCTSLLVCLLPIALCYAAPWLARNEAAALVEAPVPAGLPALPRHPGDITREIPKALLQQHLDSGGAPRPHPVTAVRHPAVPEQRMHPSRPRQAGETGPQVPVRAAARPAGGEGAER
ncbi:cellulose synthase/poly-beta-1,6-N-acetylglucosamine synthase-like glycosyltransferase [Actinoplanes octamycinicus]|uniref:Cellulose synthase/poly-beta-1,6-N-acetylglucosamine synthase-like glycosyltransferase n=1 Tax=Actinoplanes octamycinicus TaxID=135948 RepID=A0A7W7H818_9ACTN|nr:glycosyltransferase family 2 protein [Actinoplanes octamycinicus]MBB4745746.1 cellulose synthase/poly-beta-1,6-N-acetylglucosamine synthase-like glycosyltransferase [Actinoplanes octamycinicus]GIE56593.1 glycosyl transferase [Actinoplanes octamycinicus]